MKSIDYLSNLYASPGIQGNTYGPVVLAIGRLLTLVVTEPLAGAMSITDLRKFKDGSR